MGLKDQINAEMPIPKDLSEATVWDTLKRVFTGKNSQKKVRVVGDRQMAVIVAAQSLQKELANYRDLLAVLIKAVACPPLTKEYVDEVRSFLKTWSIDTSNLLKAMDELCPKKDQ